MKNLIDRAKQFKYNSLEHFNLSDMYDTKVCINNRECIFFYSSLSQKAKIDWAVNSKETFFDGLDKTIDMISQNKSFKKIIIEFIPVEYVPEMEEYGFKITSEWIDYWNNNLKTINVNHPKFLSIRKIKENEYSIASKVTKSCIGYSREYNGESTEWIKEWDEKNNSAVFVAEVDNKVIGVCCVSLYGNKSKKETVLWLREIAVTPKYHSKKIGFNLMSFAINWGIKNGAKRSFLACDIENKKAIKLYEGLGYKRKSKRGQINMEMSI